MFWNNSCYNSQCSVLFWEMKFSEMKTMYPEMDSTKTFIGEQ